MAESFPNVIVVNDNGHITGGAGAVALAEAAELHRRGVNVALLCAVGPVAPDLIAAGLPTICLDQQEIAADTNRLRAAGQGLWNIRAGRALSRLISKMPPGNTVVHVHGWTKALSSSVVRAAAGAGPVVLTLHDYFVACPTGGFYDFNAACQCPETAMSVGCMVRACDRRGLAQKAYRVVRQAVQRQLGGIPSRVTDFIYFSDFSLSLLRPYLPQNARYHLLPNPVAATYHAPCDVAAADTFLSVGRLSPEKGGNIFASAARVAGVRARFVGAGEMVGVIQAANPAAELSGWLDAEPLAAAYRNARALVFPSSWYETFGLVVAEAASHGVPAVVSDTCAARDLVIDGITGLHFRNGDVMDLARTLRELAIDPQLASRLGRAAWELFWKSPFSIEGHVDSLLEIYQISTRANLN